MHIISKKALSDFWQKHPDSEMPLKVWFKIVRASTYASFNELRLTFRSVDKVGNKVVFNIGGHKYRLITVVHFNAGKVYVRHIMTHQEYDKEGWKYG
jgi:mRNA interferase HigB